MPIKSWCVSTTTYGTATPAGSISGSTVTAFQGGTWSLTSTNTITTPDGNVTAIPVYLSSGTNTNQNINISKSGGTALEPNSDGKYPLPTMDVMLRRNADAQYLIQSEIDTRMLLMLDSMNPASLGFEIK